jgi:hypothetical protein
MTLKDFIKTSIQDITSAIEECQKELQNGTILCPTNMNGDFIVKSKQGNLNVSNIDFDVSVTTESIEQNDNGAGFTLSVVSVLSVGVGSKNIDTGKEYSASRIKFSIPIIYPMTAVELRESTTRQSARNIIR